MPENNFDNLYNKELTHTKHDLHLMKAIKTVFAKFREPPPKELVVNIVPPNGRDYFEQLKIRSVPQDPIILKGHVTINLIKGNSMERNKNINKVIANGAVSLQKQLAAANETIELLIKALEPFAHPDLCEQLQGNVQGADSPVFGRNKALLKLGDFQRARTIIDEVKKELAKPKGIER